MPALTAAAKGGCQRQTARSYTACDIALIEPYCTHRDSLAKTMKLDGCTTRSREVALAYYEMDLTILLNESRSIHRNESIQGTEQKMRQNTTWRIFS
jgi:hypothetical protein